MDRATELMIFAYKNKRRIRRTFVFVVCSVLASRLLRLTLYYRRQIILRRKAESKRQDRAQNIAKAQHCLQKTSSDIRVKIQGFSYNQLKAALQNEEVTCVQVLHAFMENAIKAHEKTNCVVEFLHESERRALALDVAHAGQTHKPPLFGLPFSVKESVSMTGYDTTNGLARFIGDGRPLTATIVETCEQAGAVPFVRTNVPMMLTFGCSNEIFGSTRNPYNQDRTSGGSSSGEGSLLAMNGAVFGIGTDLGGSIRVPATFCGIAGLKPTSTRISQIGSFRSPPQFAYVYNTSGPMSPNVKVIQDVMAVLLDVDSSTFDDIAVPRLPWNPDPKRLNRKLRIGWFDTNDSNFPVVPAMKRAVRMAVKVLQDQGHELVQFEIPDMHMVLSLFVGGVTADKGTVSADLVNNDLRTTDTQMTYILGSLPLWLRRVILQVGTCERTVKVMDSLPATATRYKQLLEQLQTYRRKLFDAWQQAKLDALVCPVNASVAPIWKLVETADMDAFIKTYPKNDHVDKLMWMSNGDASSIGLPVGVQVVGRPFDEELVLKLMADLEKHLKPQ